MSKSQGNIVDPYDVFDHIGADPLRWYFLARLAPEAQKRISTDIVAEVASSFVNTVWNTYAFFILYASLDDVSLDGNVSDAKRPEIDRWVLALLYRTINLVTTALENYDARGAGSAIETFTDQLSNWYVRRNRRRFWKSETGADKQSAYLTLYTCLDVLHRLMAPFMPFLADEMYQNLVRSQQADAPISVHLSEWPKADPNWRNDELLGSIAVVQQVVALGRAARESSRLRVRQPLSRLLARLPDDRTTQAVIHHKDQILEELNVKNLELVARDAELVRYHLKPNLPRLGARYGKLIPAIREALATANGPTFAAAQAQRETSILTVAGQEITLGPDDFLVETTAAEGYSSAESEGFLVALDTRLTPALEQEGLARELIRTVQDARKQANLEVSDRIFLRITGSLDIENTLGVHRDWIMKETLAEKWVEGSIDGAFSIEHRLDQHNWQIFLARKQMT